MPCFQQCWFQHVLQHTSSQCASQSKYGAWHVFVSDTCELHQSDQCSTANIQSAMECWECRLSIWGRMHAQSMCNLQRRHKVEGSSARKARVWWRSWSVSMAESNRWRQVEKNQVDHASWWCCGGDPQCSNNILMPCHCMWKGVRRWHTSKKSKKLGGKKCSANWLCWELHVCFGFHSQRQLCSGACSWSEGKIRQQLCCTCRHVFRWQLSSTWTGVGGSSPSWIRKNGWLTKLTFWGYWRSLR